MGSGPRAGGLLGDVPRIRAGACGARSGLVSAGEEFLITSMDVATRASRNDICWPALRLGAEPGEIIAWDEAQACTVTASACAWAACRGSAGAAPVATDSRICANRALDGKNVAAMTAPTANTSAATRNTTVYPWV